MFCSDCIKSFMSYQPKEALEKVRAGVLGRVEQLAELMLRDACNSRRKAVLGALLILHVHCRDLVINLLLRNVFKAEDFEWSR